ncbi:MAG TPA: archaellin/type IV pilin N-terminal domain-containing protein [Candidatus Angelobacter sp.]|nr:archaellin/type IV pilin N-terminal domain-containing protein [Candidatus Angelobacter sp.]
MRKIRKITRDKKGIDTILAALLMVVIVVVAAVMVYAWATGLLSALLVQNPVPKESMTMETSSFPSVTNVSLSLRNTGSVAVSLVSYYVKDSTGNQYARLTWSTDAGPNHPPAAGIAPNALGVVFLPIGTSGAGTCGTSCSLSGSSFTFTSGYSYTVTVVTARNNQFTFSITK